MRKLNIKLATVALSLALAATGCSKFLDVNENPNQPTEADVKLLLPTAAAATGNVLGNSFQINAGLWAQYWTQSPYSSQYKTEERYLTQGPAMDRPWSIIYSGALQDYQQVITNAGQFTQHAAIATLLKAFTIQMITDAWGDIPYSQALKGGDSLSVGYDSQEVVYDSIIAIIDKGIAMVDLGNQFVPGSEDLLFSGDMDQWTRFGNTLKLRAYLRIIKANETKAKAGIAALQGAEFLEEDAQITYSSTGGNENPLFSEILGLGRTQNLVASSTAVDTMNANNDPRLPVFYTVVTNEFGGVDVDSVIGIPQGSYGTTPDIATSFANAAVGGLGDDNNSALAPVKFISAAESYFLQAEAVARGILTGDAADLFEKGIAASFESYNLTAALQDYLDNAPAAQFPVAGTEAQKVEAIITQKYFAMNGNQSFEAWTEWRRTGYPRNLKLSEVGALGDKFPLRFPYPNSELTTNGKFPGPQPLTAPVWWDVE